MNIETTIDGQTVTFTANFDGHWPNYIVGQDLDYGRGRRKFTDELEKIDAAKDAVQFANYDEWVTINGVRYEQLRFAVTLNATPHLYITAKRHVKLGDPNFHKLCGQILTIAANKKLRESHGQFFIDTAQAIVADVRQQCRQRFIDNTMEKANAIRANLDEIVALCEAEGVTP
ncbi:hypothetical protein [uncultured Mediterranean phage uvMED]|nr:hypothetical protein [uncultured Mediterranean phage uvMED]